MLMALPYVLLMICEAIDANVGAGISATSDFAHVRFGKAAAETSDDEIQDPVIGMDGDLEIRVHQAQKDDFIVGTGYTFTVTAT